MLRAVSSPSAGVWQAQLPLRTGRCARDPALSYGGGGKAKTITLTDADLDGCAPRSPATRRPRRISTPRGRRDHRVARPVSQPPERAPAAMSPAGFGLEGAARPGGWRVHRPVVQLVL